MHWLDAVYLRVSRRAPLFEDGWGNLDEVLAAAAPVREPREAQPLEVKWTGTLGVARSPCALAPAEGATLRILRLAPVGPVRARCVVPPSWGDEDFAMRAPLFGPLRRHGVELWIPEGAFFGQRRRTGQRGFGLRTVGDLFCLGLCNVLELRGLVALARALEPRVPVVLAGFSMGGQLAAQAAATLPWEIPVVTLAPSDSPAPVFLDGPLRKTVSWKSLGPGAPARLRTLFEHAGVESLPRPPSKRRLVLGTRTDGIVPPAAMERLAAFWGVAPRWLDSGHLGAYLFHRRALATAVREVLE